MSRYLVTGGAGFIGSHLCDALLARGNAVRVLDDLSTGKRDNLDPKCELVIGNVADPAVVRRAMAGTVGCFHLAAIASVARANADWFGTHQVNLGGTVAVFDAARIERVPVVYASSAAIYGTRDDVASEDATPAPLSAYGADKLGSELHARAGFIVHHVSSVGFRFFNVYGPRQDPSSPYSGVISIFADAFQNGRSVTLHGDGSQTRDFIYVSDIITFLIAGMAHASAHAGSVVLNACTGREMSIHDLAAALGNLFGNGAQVTCGPPRPGDIRRSIGDPSRARVTLGVNAATNLEQGLRFTMGKPPVPRQTARSPSLAGA